MKKAVLILLTFITIFMVGCAPVADEEKIKEDLEAYSKDAFLDADEEITDIVIIKRQIEKEDDTDTVWCKVTVEDEDVAYEKGVELTYGLYDGDGWLLDSVDIDPYKEWKLTPLRGISEEELKKLLKDESVNIGEDRWDFDEYEINASSIKSLSIKERTTNLDEKTDTVTVELTLDAAVQEATGELVVVCNFDEEWFIESISGDESFIATTKPELELDVTAEELIKEVTQYNLQYGSQEIVIDEGEISDFVIESQECSARGTFQKYSCKFVLTKPYTTFCVEVEIVYEYIATLGWRVQPVNEICANVLSVDLVGEWTGTYEDVWDGECVLNITDIDEDGYITAIYSYTPSEMDMLADPVSDSGSYYVSGKWNPDELSINLDAGDWIKEPTKTYYFTKQNVSAALWVDAGVFTGMAQEYHGFTVSKE